MPQLIKIIKTIPNIDVDTFEKAYACDKFWEACITGMKVSVQKSAENCLHFDLTTEFMLDPLGVAKIPIDVSQDLLFEDDPSFSGEGKKVHLWTENSNAVNASDGYLSYKASGNDIKIMIEVTRVDLKAGFFDVAGLGKAVVISRLEQELQKLVLHLIDLAKSGGVLPLLESCT
jgi:hypothetical protein